MYNQDNNSKPMPIEKVISILSYMTGGIVGFVWFLIGTITKQRLRPFLRYHIYQSIFLSILLYVIFYALDLLFKVLSLIPFVDKLVGMIGFIFIFPIFKGFSLLNFAMVILVVYLCVGVALNRYSYIPWVSNIIKANVERG